MNTANDLTVLVDDLAGHWTEPALEILKAGGVPLISVDMELEAWRTLRKALHVELRWQRRFRLSTFVPLSTVREMVLRKATLSVAQPFGSQGVSQAFESWIWRSADERASTATERCLYAEIVRQSGPRAAFQLPSRTDFAPRLRVSASGG